MAGFEVTTEETELQKSYRYVRLFRELKSAYRAVEIQQNMVDAREAELVISINDKACDDHHIIAILCVSGCKLLCSGDKRSFKFVKDGQNYDSGHHRPRIYQRAEHKSLLCNENVVRLRNTC